MCQGIIPLLAIIPFIKGIYKGFLLFWRTFCRKFASNDGIYCVSESNDKDTASQIERLKIMLKYKIDVLAALKEKGYSTYKLEKGLLSKNTISALRNGVLIRPDSLEKICRMLDCQPGDILEYVADDPDGSENI